MLVRPAIPADFTALSILNAAVQALHASALPRIFKPPSADQFSPDAIKQLLDKESNSILVAEVGGQPAGYVYYEIVRRPETPFVHALDLLYIHHIGVAAGHRRQGVGTALVRAVRSAGDRLGISAVALDVWAFNESARAFFRRNGFDLYQERLWSS